MSKAKNGKYPGFYFFTGDWLKDPAVTACRPATRGIWMDLLCLMHEAGGRGQVSGSLHTLARMARCTEEDLVAALEELEAEGTAEILVDGAPVSRPRHGTASRVRHAEITGHVTVVCRRMQREAKAREGSALRSQRYRDKRPRHAPRHATNPTIRKNHASDMAQKGGKKREEVVEVESHGMGAMGRPESAPDSATATDLSSEEITEDFIAALQGNPAYRGLDVALVCSKLRAYCEAEGTPATRRRLVNWLNREKPAINYGGNDDGKQQIARIMARMRLDN